MCIRISIIYIYCILMHIVHIVYIAYIIQHIYISYMIYVRCKLYNLNIYYIYISFSTLFFCQNSLCQVTCSGTPCCPTCHCCPHRNDERNPSLVPSHRTNCSSPVPGGVQSFSPCEHEKNRITINICIYMYILVDEHDLQLTYFINMIMIFNMSSTSL